MIPSNQSSICQKVPFFWGLLLAGVKEVSIDPHKDLITVKGTMDAKELPNYLEEKLKRSVEVVPATTAGEKDDTKDNDGGEKKEKAKAKAREEYYYCHGEVSMEYVYAPPPHIFSDENPNACSIM